MIANEIAIMVNFILLLTILRIVLAVNTLVVLNWHLTMIQIHENTNSSVADACSCPYYLACAKR